mgnify:CR=1 FL=1
MLFSVFLRVPRLGTDIFNADAFRWKTRSYNFSNGLFGLRFAQTAQSSHPGVVLMWLGVAGVKIYNAFNDLFRGSLPSGSQQILELHFVQKFLVVVVLSFLFAFSFYLLRELTNSTIAFFAILLLTIEPYFLAHTRVFHLDALLSMFMFVSVLCFLGYLWVDRGLTAQPDSPTSEVSENLTSEVFPRAGSFPSPSISSELATWRDLKVAISFVILKNFSSTALGIIFVFSSIGFVLIL